MILGSLQGVDIGFRQLRRTTPFDTVVVHSKVGDLTIPTFDEILITEAFLLSDINYTRDFVDFAELASLIPEEDKVRALLELDKKFACEK